MQSKSIVGAQLKVYVNNRLFGIATGFTYTINPGRRPIYGLDQIVPFELAPGAYSVKGRLDFNKVRYDGGLEGRGISASQSKILLEKYIGIVVVDRVTGSVIFQAERAAINSQQWNARARDIMTGSCEYEAITWRNDFDDQS